MVSNQLIMPLPLRHLERVTEHAVSIRPYVRVESATLLEACEKAGIVAPRLCAGVLASVIEDLIEASKLARSDFERTKRKERVLAAAREPIASALRLAIAASPVNGRAAVAHWDMICEHYEVGKLAWLLGMQTETSQKYARRTDKGA